MKTLERCQRCNTIIFNTIGLFLLGQVKFQGSCHIYSFLTKNCGSLLFVAASHWCSVEEKRNKSLAAFLSGKKPQALLDRSHNDGDNDDNSVACDNHGRRCQRRHVLRLKWNEINENCWEELLRSHRNPHRDKQEDDGSSQDLQLSSVWRQWHPFSFLFKWQANKHTHTQKERRTCTAAEWQYRNCFWRLLWPLQRSLVTVFHYSLSIKKRWRLLSPVLLPSSSICAVLAYIVFLLYSYVKASQLSHVCIMAIKD